MKLMDLIHGLVFTKNDINITCKQIIKNKKESSARIGSIAPIDVCLPIGPTNNPTPTPTPAPTNQSTSAPTKNPTPVPTMFPTPTTGAYSGEFLAFNVQMAYQADFNVTTIEAYSPTNQILGQDTDHDEKIILENHPSGD
eukprot:231651_1